MLERDELAAQHSDVPLAREALRVLIDDGLVTRLLVASVSSGLERTLRQALSPTRCERRAVAEG
jgi:hypothetical protein